MSNPSPKPVQVTRLWIRDETALENLLKTLMYVFSQQNGRRFSTKAQGKENITHYKIQGATVAVKALAANDALGLATPRYYKKHL